MEDIINWVLESPAKWPLGSSFFVGSFSATLVYTKTCEWVCDHRSESQFKQLRKWPEKKFFGASTGFEPVASALALQCSPSWAMKTHILETGQFIEFINPWKEWKHWIKWCDLYGLWIYMDHTRSSHHLIQCFHSFHGLMNSINWPASSIWVFIAQLGEHCSANAEATGSNPVEAPKNFFSGHFRNCLNCDSLRWSHTHSFVFPQFTSFDSVLRLMNST